MKIKEQIDILRYRFNTGKIHNLCTKEILNETEIEAVIVVIKENKKDGVYEVNDEIVVLLQKGAAFIKNNETNE